MVTKAIELIDQLKQIDTYKRYGKISKVVGLMIESIGPPSSIGDLCYIHLPKENKKIRAEVVGFRGENVLLMPYTEVRSISPGCLVESTEEPLQIKVGMELIGKTIDSFGHPLDGSKLPEGLSSTSTTNEPPNPMQRPRILEKVSIGVRSIDGLLSVGMGQRVGIFAGSGVGKSTLLGMIARNTSADLNVIALIGERGREVKEFIEKDLGEEGLKKSVVIVATSDQPALTRIKGAITATAIAEYFRSKGKNVLLMMDSLTRVAMAQREIGLAIGEPPTTKGYPPSVFALLPQLLERSGTSIDGTITAFYTVLVDGDDLDEPISDTARGILDGHFVLDRDIANKGQYPALNILKSISRVMDDIVEQDHLEAAKIFRSNLSKYYDTEDLINIGAYKQGNSPDIDRAIRLYPKMLSYLQQTKYDKITQNEAVQLLIDEFGKEA